MLSLEVQKGKDWPSLYTSSSFLVFSSVDFYVWKVAEVELLKYKGEEQLKELPVEGQLLCESLENVSPMGQASSWSSAEGEALTSPWGVSSLDEASAMLPEWLDRCALSSLSHPLGLQVHHQGKEESAWTGRLVASGPVLYLPATWSLLCSLSVFLWGIVKGQEGAHVFA